MSVAGPPPRPGEIDVMHDEAHLVISIRPNTAQLRLQRLVLFASGMMGATFALIALFTNSLTLGLVLFLSICLPFIGAGLQTRGDRRQIILADGTLRSLFNEVSFGSELPIEAIQSIECQRRGRKCVLAVEMDSGDVHHFAGGFREDNARYIAWVLQRVLFDDGFAQERLQPDDSDFLLLSDLAVTQEIERHGRE